MKFYSEQAFREYYRSALTTSYSFRMYALVPGSKFHAWVKQERL